MWTNQGYVGFGLVPDDAPTKMVQLRGHYCGKTSSEAFFDNFYSLGNGAMFYPGDINGVTSLDNIFNDGWAICVFKRTVSVANGAENLLYDLTQTGLDSVIAVGPLSGQRPGYHGSQKDYYSDVDYQSNNDYKESF